MRLLQATISEEPLDVAAHLQLVENARAGAIALFVGTVRDHDPDMAQRIVRLDYSAHPDAQRFLHEVTERVLDELDAQGEAQVAISHRVGSLAVGEAAIVVAVATAHRKEAFALCEAIVEAVKHEVPIWKHQFGADGADVWSGLS